MTLFPLKNAGKFSNYSSVFFNSCQKAINKMDNPIETRLFASLSQSLDDWRQNSKPIICPSTIFTHENGRNFQKLQMTIAAPPRKPDDISTRSEVVALTNYSINVICTQKRARSLFLSSRQKYKNQFDTTE